MSTFLVILAGLAMVGSWTVAMFGLKAERKQKNLLPADSEETPALLGKGPYRITQAESTEPICAENLVLAPKTDKECFDQLTLARHCLDQDDPLLRTLAENMSIDFLIEELNGTNAEIAIDILQIRSKEEDVLALDPLAKSRWMHERLRCAEALKGNCSDKAIQLLFELKLDFNSMVKDEADEALNELDTTRINRALLDYLIGSKISAVKISAVIDFLLSNDVEQETIATMLSEKLRQSNSDSSEKNAAAAELAKLPGGKEMLRNLLS